MSLSTTYFIILTMVFVSNIHLAQGLNITDCMEYNEPQICYHCDNTEDSFCGNPFQYSHYYRSRYVYLTECEGCCIKIVHPTVNGTRRIQRSCTDLLPEVSFSLEENCDASASERQICFCKHGLCNGVDVGVRVNWLSVLPLLMLNIVQRVSIIVQFE